MSKRTKIIIAVVVLVVVAGAAGAVAFGARGSGPEIETAQVQKQKLAVTVTASGKIESGVSSDVFPPAAGTLDTIYVSDGETVTAGQKIAQMDTTPLELQVAQAKAGLSQAQAGLDNIGATSTNSQDIRAAQAQVDATYQSYLAAKSALAAVSKQAPSETQLAAAKAATDAAWQTYVNARNAYNAAYQAVLASGNPNPSSNPTVSVLAAQKDQAYAGYLSAKATQESLQNTSLTAARKQAQAGVDQAYAAYQGAKAQLKKAKSADPASQKAAARAAVAQAAEALSAAEETLDKATLTAPIDGVVIFNTGMTGGPKATDGSAVSPAAAPFSVVDLSALKFTAEVDEADIDRVKVGMPAEVTLDAFPGEQFKTTVARINPAAQPTATGGTVFAVELELADTGKAVLIGMKGDATIEVSSTGSALTIPVEALFSEGGTDFVYLVVDGTTLKKTEITVGATTDVEVEVLTGLKEGDTVALSGTTQYTDGMTVRVKQN